jgi:hypothetical protein
VWSLKIQKIVSWSIQARANFLLALLKSLADTSIMLSFLFLDFKLKGLLFLASSFYENQNTTAQVARSDL